MMDAGESNRATETAHLAKGWVATGVFLVVLATYVLSSPGRIDVFDGQARYEVAYNWLLAGRPIIREPVTRFLMGFGGRHNLTYSHYGAGGSLFAIPLVWMGTWNDDPPGETSRFLFSLTCCVFGALICAVLYLFYLELDISSPRALAWTFVTAFTTMLWPCSITTFDNAQHAFFAMGSLYLGFLSAKRQSRLLAATGGVVAGILLLYQEYFLLILPALAISTLSWSHAGTMAESQDPMQGKPHPGKSLACQLRQGARAVGAAIRSACQQAGQPRESCLRFLLFLASISVGAILYLAYNNLRFGSFFQNGNLAYAAKYHYPTFGNPIAGFLTLLASPGKSVFLYSPPLILGLWGFRYLWRRKPELGCAIMATSTVLVLFISCITFAGGDWCWGPRYMAVLLPLWPLAFPFVSLRGRLRRNLVLALLAAGLVVQGLGLSMENQRYFFERALKDFFWADDSWYYFKHSALFARVGEVASLTGGLPPEACAFNPMTYPGLSTFTIFGPPPKVPRRLTPEWMRQFKVFYLPKPWPIWMWTIRPELRAINLEACLGALFGMALLGVALIFHGFQMVINHRAPQEICREKELARPEALTLGK
jgi:hypothetical protein